MDNNIKTVIENSKAEAEKFINSTAEIEKAYAVGRPNSAPELSVEGTLRAFTFIVSEFSPGYKIIK